MKKFIIDRRTWIRGPDEADAARLFRPSDGKMCCLGFYLQSCGYSQEQMKNLCMPIQLGVSEKLPEWLIKRVMKGWAPESSEEACHATEINDMEFKSEKDREDMIKEVFLKHNIEVEFAN